MKRKAESLPLWEAACVNGSGTLRPWIDKTQIREFTADKRSCSSCDYTDVRHEVNSSKDVATSTSKIQKLDKPTPITTTFSVGIRPTPKQKQVLNQMLRVSHYAYNWCNYLVKEKNFKPNHFDIQKVVGKTNAESVPTELRLPGDDWYFDNQMTRIKGTSCKQFCTMYKSATSNMKKKKLTDQTFIMKDKDMSPRQIGSFQVPHQLVRFLNEKDSPSEDFRKNRIALMPKNFAKTKKDANERYLRLSKNVSKLPPLSHDMMICKRANGKFVLQIPCDPIYTRKTKMSPSSEAICSIDPGGRTFATVYDPTNLRAYQVGTKEDKARNIRKIHDRIDQVHERLTKAQKRNQTQEVENRKSQLRKLHLKLKTYVNDTHLKLSSSLVDNYKCVSLGKISVSSIVKKDKAGNGLAKRAKRDLLAWQHYRFRERLLHRAKDTNCEVIVQDESYTSQTCGRCGIRNKNLGSSETFICPNCNYSSHRDINGARNILLKSLRKFPFA